MAIENPVAIYTARSNQEALLLKNLLEANDIEVAVTDDTHFSASWIGGTLPSHRPKVWVDQNSPK